MRITKEETIQFLTRLEKLLSAGISLPDALGIVSGKVAISIALQIRSGKSFHESVSVISGIPPFVSKVIEIGETHGSLRQVLVMIVTTLKRSATLHRKIAGALVYPILVLVLCVFLVFGLFVFIIPKMLRIFDSMRITLPLPTRILIFIHHALSDGWLYILGFLIMSTSFLFFLYRYTNVSFYFEKLLFKIPILNTFIKNALIAQLFGMFSLLMSAELSCGESLRRIAEVSPYKVVRLSLFDIAERVGSGRSLTESLIVYSNLYTPTLIDMIRAGEASGALPELCEHAALLHESDLIGSLETLSKLIEPFLMICIGCITAFVALALMMPLYDLTSQLQR